METESPPSRGSGSYWRQSEPGVIRGTRLYDDDSSTTRNRLSFSMYDTDDDNDHDDHDSSSRKGKTPARPPSGGLMRKIHVRNPFDDLVFSGDEEEEESSPTTTTSSSGAKENDPMTFAFNSGGGGGTRQMQKRLQKMGDYNHRRHLPRRNNSHNKTNNKAFANVNSFDSDDNNNNHNMMLSSPYVSPSTYITMDGRCVMSENPFSPMNTEGDGKSLSLRPVAPSIPFSFTFDDESSTNQLSHTRHRLEKRNASSPMDSTLLVPSFMDTSFSSSTPESPPITNTNANKEGHKVRRLGVEGDVHFPTRHTHFNNNNLFVDTTPATTAVAAALPRYKSSSPPIDEISPTDVSAFPDVTSFFPTPPTPAKYNNTIKQQQQRRADHYPNNYLSTPPGTPPLRRTMQCPSGPLTASRYHHQKQHGNNNHDHTTSPLGGMETTAVSTSRFQSDFDLIDELGKGTFGVVYKVLSRLDGCMYAMKVALRSAKGNMERKRMLQEVSLFYSGPLVVFVSCFTNCVSHNPCDGCHETGLCFGRSLGSCRSGDVSHCPVSSSFY
jgi:hypothetical protein